MFRLLYKLQLCRKHVILILKFSTVRFYVILNSAINMSHKVYQLHISTDHFKDFVFRYENTKPCWPGGFVRWYYLLTHHVVIHSSDVIMSAMASRITSLTIVYSTVYSVTDQRKHQSSASLAFVRGIHRSGEQEKCTTNLRAHIKDMLKITQNVHD